MTRKIKYIFLVIFALAFCTGAYLAEPPTYDYEYHTVIIREGDTAWDKCYKYYLMDEANGPYGEYIYLVGEHNNVKMGELSDGQILILPVRKEK